MPTLPAPTPMSDCSRPNFDDMKLQVGARLQLILARAVQSVHFSSLIGYVPDEYILVKIPVEHGLPITMHEGEHITVRVFSGVSVYTFACTIASVLLVPYHYLHLSFPKEIECTPLWRATYEGR